MKRAYNSDDLAYAAGFLDGEGCFSVNENRWVIAIAASNTNKPVIEWLHRMFGGTMHRHYRPRRENHRAIYTWQAVRNDAAEVCAIIVPYLKEKAPQALTLIAIHQTMRRSSLRGNKLKPEIIEERRHLAIICKEAKRATWS